VIPGSEQRLDGNHLQSSPGSFSLREKVAEGRMRGINHNEFMRFPSPWPSPSGEGFN